MTDPIADYLTRMRNALMAKHKVVNIPSSKIKRAMTQALLEKGYILNYKVEGSKESNRSIGTQDNLKIALKYDTETKQPAIKKLIRVSKPGLRKYANADSLPRVLNGLGVAIVSTSKGVMTDKEARKEHIGGEVLCHIY
jgi:small subunit ribosomal protein S8